MIEISIVYLTSIILSVVVLIIEVNTDKDVKDLEYKEKLDLICEKQEHIDISYFGICFIPIINSIIIVLYILELFRRSIQYVLIKKEKVIK